MDSKEKLSTGIPQVEVPRIRVGVGRASGLGWVGGALLVLVAGVVASGVVLTVVDSGEERAATRAEGTAPQTAEETIDELLAAISSADTDAAAELYAEDAIVVALTTDGYTPDVRYGRTAVRAMLAAMVRSGDLTMERASDVITRGRLAGYLELYHGSGGWEGMYGITVFLFDEKGKIAGQTTLYT